MVWLATSTILLSGIVVSKALLGRPYLRMELLWTVQDSLPGCTAAGLAAGVIFGLPIGLVHWWSRQEYDLEQRQRIDPDWDRDEG